MFILVRIFEKEYEDALGSDRSNKKESKVN